MKAIYVKSRQRRVIQRGVLYFAQEEVARPDGCDKKREHGWRDMRRGTDLDTAIGQIALPRDGLAQA